MPPWRGTEAVPNGGVGGKDRDIYCDQHLWEPPFPIHLLQLPWDINIGIGRRLAGGGAQPTEGMIEVGATVEGVGKGGRGCPDLGKNLPGSGPGGPAVWVGDVGDDTTHWGGVGRITQQVGTQADETTTLEGGRREVGVSPTVRSYGRGGVTGVGELRLLPPEYSHTVD